MLLEFDKMEETLLPHFKGGEGDTRARMYLDDINRIMLTALVPGASIGLHTHDTSSEIIFILSGQGKALCDGKTESLRPGVCQYCPKGSEHSIINDGTEDLVFYAAVPQQ